ncbi:MAG: alpha/beta hydrolase [Spirochaetales bacterium]|nr:alpha/beta hydrolase [Spirochaetales bacterium]
MKMIPDSLFKNDEGEKEYFALYRKCLKNWPIPYEEQFIDTSFGKTYIIVTGNKKGRPAILCHGMLATPASWYPNITALAEKYSIYVPGYPGDLGPSDFRKSPRNPEQAAAWLDELRTVLGIEKPVIMGTSFGGFLGANYAIRYPDHVEKLVLLSPAGVFAPLRKAFFVRAILCSLFPKPGIIRNTVKWFYDRKNFKRSDFSDMLETGLRYGIPRLYYAPAVFVREDLAKISCPVLLLLGRKEAISNPKKAFTTAARHLKNRTCRIIDYAGHLLPLEQVDAVNREFSNFLSGISQPNFPER